VDLGDGDKSDDGLQIKRKPIGHGVLIMRRYLSLRLNEMDRTFIQCVSAGDDDLCMSLLTQNTDTYIYGQYNNL
jgi:hypothetical protein